MVMNGFVRMRLAWKGLRLLERHRERISFLDDGMA
jgi:hypothetical protein